MKKYDNKFHKMKFETNAEQDIKENNISLPSNIQGERISDDFSNQQAAEYSSNKQ